MFASFDIAARNRTLRGGAQGGVGDESTCSLGGTRWRRRAADSANGRRHGSCLDNMRQRARSLGGELELIAQARGTSVRLRILSDPRTKRDDPEVLP